MIILQGAIFASMVIFSVSLGLIVLFSILFSSLFINIGRKKFLNNNKDKLTLYELFVYFICILLGFITAFGLVILIMYLFILIMSKSGVTFD